MAKKGGKVTKAVKKYVKAVVDNEVEDKYSHTRNSIAAGTAATNSSGSIVPLVNSLSNGTLATERIGNKIKAKDLEVMIDMQPDTSATDDTNFRIIIYQDRQLFGSGPTAAVTDVLETVNYNSFYENESVNAGRFRILYDKLHQLDPIIPTSLYYTTQTYQSIKRKFKINNNIDYSGSGVFDFQKNTIFMLMISDKATADAPAINYSTVLRFEDA